MSSRINAIKNMVKAECRRAKKLPHWFYRGHLLAVEKYSRYLLRKLPKANRQIVMLGVWLHDLQRVREKSGDHQKVGAREAGKVMRDFGYGKDTIDKVQKIILTHSCDQKRPCSLEGKVLATADALSHYTNDFYLQIAITDIRNLAEFKTWALEKLKRDYRVKIFFPFARKKIAKCHQAWLTVLAAK